MTDRLYERISFDSKVSGSITKQNARLMRSADPDDFEVYEERSVSGAKVPFADRPEGKRLLTALQPGDRVLVTKIDRAARNVRDLLDLVEKVEALGCSIVFVDQAIDTAGPMGRFLLTLLGAIAELEAGIVAERRRESLAQFAAEGRHAVGRAPFGLRSVPNPNGRGLVLRPDPDEAPVVREAVEAVLAGESQRAWSERCGMRHPAFGRLLRNERLAGIIGRDEDGTPRLDPEQALFSLAEWARLQDHLRRPEKPHRARTDGYGPAFACGVCGDRLYLNVSKRSPAYTTYRCRGVRHAPGQPAASVMRVNADRLVEEEFLSLFGHLPVLAETTTDSSAVRDEAVARARLTLDAIRKAQDETDDEDEEERLFVAYREAKKALRDAEALPRESVTAEIPTGESFAELWATSDDEARTAFLLRFGPWTVEPGRLPIEKKVHLDREPDYLAGQV